MPAFLFTDLEASTRLWEEHPEAMQEALARHDAMLRKAVEGANGSVVKTTGDGLMAVFDSVDDSLAASVAAQRALTTAAWGSTGPLRVRMGLHAGEAEPRAGDYYGPAVNRAARIMATGHGGQILVSGAVASLTGRSLPDGVSLRDLGTHRLKDLTDPEHLFQLVVAGLPSDFPSLATLDTRPNNLPVQDSEFFGRTAELAGIQTMLDDPSIRLVTLIGPGGTGKTRLALQAAAERLDHYPDGVFFVDLSRELDPDAAYEAIDRELDLPGSTGGHPLRNLESKLRDRRMLLVLDNFEQVADAAVGVGELLARCPDLEIIVTSREALRIRAEHLFPVPPLSLPDPRGSVTGIADTESVRLLIERARSVVPGFAITEENASAIAEICVRLDGLPLALELAAARLKVFSPRDLRDRLLDTIDVLGAGGRDLPARQRTMRGTIEWSYGLLDRHQCRMFELMSVFSGARLEAVEAVAASALGDVDVVDLLASLVDQSLVRGAEVQGSVRFSMLNTIREYATERIDRDPEVARDARRAHAEYFSAYAQSLRETLRGPRRDETLDELATEIGNLRAAWRHWVDEEDLERLYFLLDGLWALHDARGWYHASIELASDMLAVLATSEPSPERAAEELALRTSLARALLAVRGYTPEVEDEFRRVLDLMESAGSAARRFPVLRALATYYVNVADFQKGAEIGRELLDLAERENDDGMIVEGLFVLGSSTAFSGDLANGLSLLDRAIELFDPATQGRGRFRLGTSPGVVARVAAGILRWQSGELDRGPEMVAEALEVARKLKHPFSLAYALYHNGYLALDRQAFGEARERAIELASVAAEHDYRIWSALASVLEGVALTWLGDTEKGLDKAEAGVDIYQGLTTPPVFWPLLLGLRAVAYANAGEHEKALGLVDEAIEFTGNQVTAYSELRLQRGHILGAEGSVAEAEEAYRDTILGATQTGMRLFELRALVGLMQIGRGDAKTRTRLQALYDSFTEGLGTPYLIAARAAF